MKYQSSFRRIFPAIFTTLSIIAGLLFAPAATRTASAARTFIVLTQYQASLSAGQEFYLGAVVSSGRLPSFKSSNAKVASVNRYGLVTAKHAGSCRITAKADGSESSCRVTVARTKITLSTRSISMENGETKRLQASTTGSEPVSFSSNKKSVAVVDSDGVITACKPGSAIISITAGKTTATCRVTVKKPSITSVSYTHLTLPTN